MGPILEELLKRRNLFPAALYCEWSSLARKVNANLAQIGTTAIFTCFTGEKPGGRERGPLLLGIWAVLSPVQMHSMSSMNGQIQSRVKSMGISALSTLVFGSDPTRRGDSRQAGKSAG